MTSENIMLTQGMKIFLAVLACAAIIFLQRAFPFLLFSKKNPPKIILFIEKYIPPMIMTVLLFYCLKDLNFSSGLKGFFPYISGILLTILLHLWKNNSLLSIFGGTIVYMILIRIF